MTPGVDQLRSTGLPAATVRAYPTMSLALAIGYERIGTSQAIWRVPALALRCALPFAKQAGWPRAAPPSEESPDTEGQDAGETPGGESRRKVEQRGDRRRTHVGKGETVG
jgi:hypothetical protein